MYFEISPVSKPLKIPRKPEPEEINILSLAPFTSIPKIFFENVPVGQSCNKRIIVKNPTSLDKTICITQEPPEERHVSLSWKAATITPSEEAILEITWCPQEDGSWRDKLQVRDKNSKWDIPIVFKCISGNTKNKNKKVSVKLRKASSPVNPKKMTIKKATTEPLAPTTQRIISNNFMAPPITDNRRETYCVSNKENVLPFQGKIPTITIEDLGLKDDAPCTPLMSLSSQRKLQNLTHTPLMETPTNLTKQTFYCSTEEKSKNDESNFLSTSRNLSGGTYVKGNLSMETFVKGNASTETYTVDDSVMIVQTKKKELDESDLSQNYSFNMEFSPIPKINGVEKVRAWNGFNGLSQVLEESVENIPPKPVIPIRKRNSGFAINLEPVKKRTPERMRSPTKNIKRIGFSKKNLNLKAVFNKARIAPAMVCNPQISQICNPYVLAATSGVDPFMDSAIFYDAKWLDDQELRFKKWLNVLLMPPEDLCNNTKPVNIAQIWQQCKPDKEDKKAPSKEEVSNKMHKNKLLTTLRCNAMKLYRTPEMMTVLGKCARMVQDNKISIRDDKNIHLNIGLQKEMLNILFCYNPLWLRIGLETIFDCTIALRSNADHVGLTVFLLQHFFNNSYLLQKYKHKSSAHYAKEIKKHVVVKFLSLIYFLDKAKVKNLIPYDPCLFCKDAFIKESKDMLMHFNRELVSSMGDLSKILRHVNYVLEFKQGFIHEFEYGVENLGCDLRDGIRLTKLMEIVLLKPDLTRYLRVPPISRLQKIHNVKVAFDYLIEANYKIISGIEPKDIVEGHREKTLSFLWQIIYKFQSPRYTKAIISVQKWWRSEPVQNKLRAIRKERQLKQNSAALIQKWYRRQKRRILLQKEIIPMVLNFISERKHHLAARKIQKTFRMYIARKKYQEVYNSALVIQRYFRAWLSKSQFRARRSAALVIQNCWKSYKIRQNYLKLKMAVLSIETRYLANKEMKRHSMNYLKLKMATIAIQQRFRAKKMMKTVRLNFISKRNATIKIQRYYRATVLMRKQRMEYLLQIESALVIQKFYRSNRVRSSYVKLKESAIIIQRKVRATIKMKIERRQYLEIKNATIVLQKHTRSYLLMKSTRSQFLALRNAVLIVQKRYRALKLMQRIKNDYLHHKALIIFIQSKIRAYLARRRYMKLKNAAVVIQQKFRATLLMKQQRKYYLALKESVKVIEERRKATLLTKIVRNDYLKLKKYTTKCQAFYRGILQRRKYLEILNAVRFIQIKWKATMMMKNQKQIYSKQRLSVVKIQRWYRSCKETTAIRGRFLKMKWAVGVFESRFSAQKEMIQKRNEYLKMKNTTIRVQRRFRANILCKFFRFEFLKLKFAVKTAEDRYSALLKMRTCMLEYSKMKSAAITIQRKYRAQVLMEKERDIFIQKRQAVITIQRFYRGYKLMLLQQKRKIIKLETIIKLQAKCRGMLVRKVYAEFLTPEAIEARKERKLQEVAAVKIQKVFRGYLVRRRATKEMKAINEKYKNIKETSKHSAKTISMRTELALGNMERKIYSTRMIHGLKELEYITGIFKEICISVSEKYRMKCYEVISSTNRSNEGKYACSFAAGILVNISKCTEVKENAWHLSGVDCVFTAMIHYCTFEEDTFNKLATLIWIFAHDARYFKQMQRLPNFKLRLTKIMQLCERRQRMANNLNKSCCMMDQRYPSLTPDWGLDLERRPRIFGNAVHAAKSLLSIFNL